MSEYYVRPSRPHPYCRICGDMIDGLGAELGETRCWWCSLPAQVGRNAKREDPPSGLRPKDEHAVAEGDAPTPTPKGAP